MPLGNHAAEKSMRASAYPSIFCRNLTFRYEEKARPTFEDVSFSVERGEAVLLMGPSGCGKSTLAYCLAGLYPEYAGTLTGELRVEGADIAQLSPNVRAKRVSILFQNPDNQFCMGQADHEILFALENIAYPGDMRARSRELLRFAGLEWAKNAPIHTLSGGTKQKIALAAALATEAKTLILDEPFANVDLGACAELSKRLKSLNEEGLTLFIVDHRLDYWRSFLSRVMIMDGDGRIRETVYPAELENRKSVFVERGLFFGNERLLGLAPSPPPPSVENAVVIEDLSVAYGRKVVFSSLSLTVRKGTITALIGENGSGKSTLLSAIAGLIRFRGTLDVFAEVGLVFQNPRYQFLSLKVRDEIRITLKSARRAQADDRVAEAEIEALLAEFGLTAYADASPYVLSQGQQRRLAILSMLAGSRPILLLDEPTYAQDEQSTFFIMDLLQKRVSRGLTAIIATHDHALARAFAHRVLCLKDGALLEWNDGEPAA